MPEEQPASDSEKKGINWPLVAITGALALLSAAEYWAILNWDEVAREDKVTAILAIIGAYGLGIGFFRRMKGLSDHIQGMIADLVSPDAVDYLWSNLTYLSIVVSTTSIGLKSDKTETPHLIQFLLSSIALIAMVPCVFIYVVFHLLIVLPISYPAVLVAASVVRAYETASGDAVLRVWNVDDQPEATGQHLAPDEKGEPSAPTGAAEISLKGFVTKDKVAAAAFIMGLPAATLALIAKVALPFV